MAPKEDGAAIWPEQNALVLINLMGRWHDAHFLPAWTQISKDLSLINPAAHQACMW